MYFLTNLTAKRKSKGSQRNRGMAPITVSLTTAALFGIAQHLRSFIQGRQLIHTNFGFKTIIFNYFKPFVIGLFHQYFSCCKWISSYRQIATCFPSIEYFKSTTHVVPCTQQLTLTTAAFDENNYPNTCTYDNSTETLDFHSE